MVFSHASWARFNLVVIFCVLHLDAVLERCLQPPPHVVICYQTKNMPRAEMEIFTNVVLNIYRLYYYIYCHLVLF